VRFENPPTKKNKGMTWRTQVRMRAAGTASSALAPLSSEPFR
jgi:hypothetical protein